MHFGLRAGLVRRRLDSDLRVVDELRIGVVNLERPLPFTPGALVRLLQFVAGLGDLSRRPASLALPGDHSRVVVRRGDPREVPADAEVRPGVFVPNLVGSHDRVLGEVDEDTLHVGDVDPGRVRVGESRLEPRRDGARLRQPVVGQVAVPPKHVLVGHTERPPVGVLFEERPEGVLVIRLEELYEFLGRLGCFHAHCSNVVT